MDKENKESGINSGLCTQHGMEGNRLLEGVGISDGWGQGSLSAGTPRVSSRSLDSICKIESQLAPLRWTNIDKHRILEDSIAAS